MRKLLWIGDADVATGFARCTHHTLDVLRQTWEVHVLGLNYRGDPHQWPYAIYPCWPGGDAFGLGRVKSLAEKIRPDVVIVQNDPWNILEYSKRVPEGIPVVATMPVDGKNCAPAKTLNGLALAIFWTRFGREEAIAGGYTGPTAIIPLGIDLDIYKPMPQREAREKIGLPPEVLDAFIVGNVNRNQPRKRLDLTIEYFAKWIHRSNIENAYLYLQIAPTGDLGYDVKQLMHYYGLKGDQKRLILVEPHIGHGLKEEILPAVYSSFDAQLTTTQGEGWGLTTMEGMACGVPQIVPDWSALGEWTEDAAFRVQCTSTSVTPNFVNVVGGIADQDEAVTALDLMYQTRQWSDNHSGWLRYREKGLALVQRPEYRWPAVGQAFAEALDQVLARKAV